MINVIYEISDIILDKEAANLLSCFFCFMKIVYADPKTAAARTWNRSQPHFEPHAYGR